MAEKLWSVLSLRMAIRLNFFELAEEILDEVSPLVDLQVDVARLASSRVLGDDHFRPAFVEVGDDPIGVEGLVGDQPAELDAFDERRDADRIEALSWH